MNTYRRQPIHNSSFISIKYPLFLISMKMRNFFWIMLFTLLPLLLRAQETVYLANGNRSPGKLTAAEGEKLTITVNRSGKPANFSLRRENILLAFAADGRFLVVSLLDADPAKAQAEIEEFNRGNSSSAYDVLVKSNPPSVVAGSISYESDELVNYKSSTGVAASINKRELAAIIYRNGRHRLVTAPNLAAPALISTRSEVFRLLTAPPPLSVRKAAPAPARAPVVKPVGKPTLGGKSSAMQTKSVPVGRPASARQSEPEKPAEVVRVAAAADPAPGAADSEKPTLNDAQYQEYRASALQRVDEFVAYLNVITDKDLDDDQKDKAIKEAVALFMPDATIDVASSKRPGVRKYKIESYLKNLKMLPYASTSIEWTEMQYVSELTQATDGNYYGLITGQQTFTGYAENGKDVLYTDVTEKSVKVKLESYRKSGSDGPALKWAVLLGNIGLVTK